MRHSVSSWESHQNKKKLVVDFDQTTLLSAEACENLGLLTVNPINCIKAAVGATPLTEQDIMTDFTDLFEGLGQLPGEYHIDLDPTVKPVQHNPRRVPQALKKDLRKEIDRLVVKGALQKVTIPTDWIGSMVVVRKTSGKLRVCIDPKDLNHVIKRSHYPMTTVELRTSYRTCREPKFSTYLTPKTVSGTSN